MEQSQPTPAAIQRRAARWICLCHQRLSFEASVPKAFGSQAASTPQR